jgi:hypothetical protein
VADLDRRAAEWDQKLARWQREGRDTAQLQGSLAFIHGWIHDPNPSQRSLAKSTLDALDHMITQPPPVGKAQ